MTLGLSKVLLIGNLGADPQLRYTQDAVAVTTFSVAVNRSSTSQRPGGQENARKPQMDGKATDWYRVVAWRRLAEQCAEYLRKGSKVYIEGRLQSRDWQDREGHTYRSIEVVATQMLVLDGRTASRESGSDDAFSSDDEEYWDDEGDENEDEDTPF